MVTENNRLTGILLTIALILSIPFIAMQFTDEVNWSLFDFIIAGSLLLGAGLLYEFVLRTFRSTMHRLVIGAVLLMTLFLVWAELAVGVFGTPFAGN